jgi:hypothetical protein
MNYCYCKGYAMLLKILWFSDINNYFSVMTTLGILDFPVVSTP